MDKVVLVWTEVVTHVGVEISIKLLLKYFI